MISKKPINHTSTLSSSALSLANSRVENDIRNQISEKINIVSDLEIMKLR